MQNQDTLIIRILMNSNKVSIMHMQVPLYMKLNTLIITQILTGSEALIFEPVRPGTVGIITQYLKYSYNSYTVYNKYVLYW